MVADYGLCREQKACFSQEVKSAHFGKGQITLHPTVCFYMSENGLVLHSLMMLSDDIQHDYHAVHHYTIISIEALKKAAPRVQKVYIFSDRCAGQYKGRSSFADLSLYTGKKVERCFFGSEHGKGEADGETGVLSQSLSRAVAAGRVKIRDASDLYAWCCHEMTRKGETFRREFYLVSKDTIERNRPSTDVVTVQGTRRIHQAERVSDYITCTRQLACFCEACRDGQEQHCSNQSFTGPYPNHSPG